LGDVAKEETADTHNNNELKLLTKKISKMDKTYKIRGGKMDKLKVAICEGKKGLHCIRAMEKNSLPPVMGREERKKLIGRGGGGTKTSRDLVGIEHKVGGREVRSHKGGKREPGGFFGLRVEAWF